MASEVVVRRATRDDAPALAELSIESSAFYARLAPDAFAQAERDGLAEWIAVSVPLGKHLRYAPRSIVLRKDL